jgi:N-dimethylarginine dimethylaminohydrolase
MKIIKDILLCPPDHFQVTYKINPWMSSKINREEASRQWLKLTGLYQNLGLKVNLVQPQPQLPDMVFAADQGLVKNQQFVLANFRFSQRQPEQAIYRQWFANHGFQVLKLPGAVYFEGGDALDLGKKILLGYGFRTNCQAVKLIAQALKIPVVSLELINPKFYHLDTCLFSPQPEVAFFYPPAFTPETKEKLVAIFPKLLPIKKNEALNWAANSLTTDHQVITQKDNPHFKRQLEELGFRVHTTNANEFTKAGGGIHCLGLATKWRN